WSAAGTSAARVGSVSGGLAATRGLHDRHAELDLTPSAVDHHRYPAADLRVGDDPLQLPDVVDLDAVDAPDHVAGTQTRLVGRAAAVHLVDEQPARIRELELPREPVVHRHQLDEPDRAPADLAVADQIVHDPARQVARHRDRKSVV